ncbi:MAG: TIGR02647 family protein [Gammaproteobacteria bacterium]|nr:TIGR02647 family protein [Gammaproteobacteria bacterium]
MHLDSDLIEELNLLARYRMTSTPAGGVEVGQAADPAVIAAAQRLYDKGLIERVDGGNLTDSGRQAVDSLSRLLGQLQPPLEPI